MYRKFLSFSKYILIGNKNSRLGSPGGTKNTARVSQKKGKRSFAFLGTYIRGQCITSVGKFASSLTLALVLVTVCDVLLRYVFKSGSVAVQELEWHLFSLIFLLGAAYTFKEDGHVRVDIFYSKFSKRNQALVNFFGILFFLIPFSLVVIWSSLPFVENSFQLMESSADPGGLPFRYLIKSAIPISFVFLLLEAVLQLCSNFRTIFGRGA